MREIILDLEEFEKGFYDLKDTTKAPVGSLRKMRNAQVTNKGGIAPRPGVILVGDYNDDVSPCRGFTAFKKSFAQDEFLVKCYGEEMEAIARDYDNLGWFRVRNGFTSGQEFGFVTSLVNSDNQDYLIGCNRYEPYFRWTGSFAVLDGALAGGETAVVVDSTITDDIFESQTASSASATTVTVPTSMWATDQWNGFYIYITSGTHAGKVRLITDTTGDTITFDTLGSTPGTCTFEVRQLKFPASGTLIYGGTEIAYTAVPTATSLSVASAHAAADQTPVTLAIASYVGDPRGDRLANYLNRIVVGHVRSAIARGAGGALQGFSAGGSAFVSKINDPFDFGYTAARVAGEGDIISMPYGGGEITDVVTHEDAVYVTKDSYIEQIQYSQDINDLPVRTPLKAGIGSVGKTMRGTDEFYFLTKDKQFTSISRVKSKDIKPETLNIGTPVQNFLQRCGVDSVGRGREIEGKVYIPVKSSESVAENDIVLIYNKRGRGYFEGVWELPVFGIEEMGGSYYFAESNSPNVYRMLTDQHADVVGDDRYPIVSEVATHFINLAASNANLQAMCCLFVEGYIRGGTTVNFRAWKDFEDEPFLTFKFAADEAGLLDGSESSASLGGKPLGVDPMGATFSEPGEDGRRHFSFRVYFPYQYANYFSVGHLSDQADDDYEVTRYGLGIKEDPAVKVGRIKTL